MAAATASMPCACGLSLGGPSVGLEAIYRRLSERWWSQKPGVFRRRPLGILATAVPFLIV